MRRTNKLRFQTAVPTPEVLFFSFNKRYALVLYIFLCINNATE
uniref:Uncharacterized protein n=1 Tax=Anguilla anguilla TaxID=7936 RepID=A0A0E9P5R6_ANGAN